MYRSRNLEEGNWNYHIKTKGEDRCNIVIMRPSIIIPFLHVRVSSCLQIKLQAVYCGLAISQKGVLLGKGHFERFYLLCRGDAHSCKGIVPKGFDNKTHSKSQVNRKIRIGTSRSGLRLFGTWTDRQAAQYIIIAMFVHM
jgi:hypothetical protein